MDGMNAYRIRKLGDLWQLLSPSDGSCIGVCEDLTLMLQSALSLAETRGREVYLFGDGERLDAVFMNLSRPGGERPDDDGIPVPALL
jgi:hypothetical protein